MKRFAILGALLALVGCGDAGSSKGSGGSGGSGDLGGFGDLVECDEVATKVEVSEDGSTETTTTVQFARYAGDPTAVRLTLCGNFGIVNGERSAGQNDDFDVPHHGDCHTSTGANFTGSDIFVRCSTETVTVREGVETHRHKYGAEQVWIRFE